MASKRKPPPNNMNYKYSGKTWTPRPTFADGNCFFHALFGEIQTGDDGQYYWDKQALNRRRLWKSFLAFFQHEEMPKQLVELIQKCFIAINNNGYNDPNNPTQLLEYARSVSEHCVLVEEIPLISALWNVRVVLFLKSSEPEIIEPDPLLLENFPFKCDASLSEVVIRFTDSHFEKLDPSPAVLPVIDNFKSKAKDKADSDTDDEIKSYHVQHNETYPKRGGNAGQHGSDYQVKVSSMVIVNALKRLKEWKISTENVEAHPFDDLVLENDFLMQIKHKTGKKPITSKALFSRSSDFSLPRYLEKFFQNIKERFTKEKIIICTNAELQIDKTLENMLTVNDVEEDNVLHFEGALNKYFTFNDAAIPVLKEKYKNSTGEPENDIKEEDIKDFLTRLQFFHGFIDGNNIINSFKKLIPSISLAKDLDSEDTFEHINKITLNWFKEEKGNHFVRLDAVAMFCDIRSRRYCEKFKQYDAIHFNNDIQSLTKQIIHVIPCEEPILNIVKLYQAIKEEKSLFLNPDDNLDIQKQVVDVFSIGNYKILVIALDINVATELTQRICKMAGRTLVKDDKKLILIAKSENELAQHIKLSNEDLYEELREEIEFKDLTELSQSMLRERRAIVFQGIHVTLNELLGKDINGYVDPQTLARLVKNQQITVGTKLAHADDNISSCYISRSLERQGEKTPEAQFRDLDYLPSEIIVVICDTSGMGKTTLLTNLAIQIKEAHPSLYVVGIDLNSKHCSRALKAALKDTTKRARVEDLLNSQENTRLKSKFAKNLFNKKANVVLMIDAVDEVQSDYIDTVTAMINEAKGRENFRRIFVTTRPHLRQELEKKLNVTAFSLQPLSRDDQKDFLTKYWTHRLCLENEQQIQKCRKYAEALIKEMSRWINDSTENSFAGIPLQTRMLAEVFQSNSKLDNDQPRQWEECTEFLHSNHEEPRLPDKINLIHLYELFVEKKLEVFVDKFSGNSVNQQMLTVFFEQCHKFHYTLALTLVFSKSEHRGLFHQYGTLEVESALKDCVLRMGIVYEVDKSPNFIHRTFAEYFVAKCIVLELKEGHIKDGFCAFLMNVVLTKPKYHVVRLFFDAFIQNELESIPDTTLASFRNFNYILTSTDTMLLYQFAANGLVGIIRFLLACIQFAATGNRHSATRITQVDTRYSNKQRSALHEACIKGHLDVTKILVEAGADVEVTDIQEKTPLHMAAFYGHYDLVEYLVNAGADASKMDLYRESILHSAVKGGSLEIVKFLVGHSGSNYEGLYNAALHLAVSGGHKSIVEYLVKEIKVDLNIVDTNGDTLLHVAASKGFTKTVEFLVGHGSDVNAKDRKGNTPRDVAMLGGFSKMVDYF